MPFLKIIPFLQYGPVGLLNKVAAEYGAGPGRWRGADGEKMMWESFGPLGYVPSVTFVPSHLCPHICAHCSNFWGWVCCPLISPGWPVGQTRRFFLGGAAGFSMR
jgi:hypothetical protein